MKKKIFAVLCCMLFAFSAGCGKKEAPETPDTPVTETETALQPEAEELQQMYTDAAAIFEDISLSRFELDYDTRILEGERAYYRVTDERFADISEFQTYLSQYFTTAFIQKELLTNDLLKEGKDGGVYMLEAGRGNNIFYAGYAMGEPVAAADAITMDVTAYYTADETPYDGEYFNTVPENADDFKTEVFQFRLVQENGGWKFDDFTIFY